MDDDKDVDDEVDDADCVREAALCLDPVKKLRTYKPRLEINCSRSHLHSGLNSARSDALFFLPLCNLLPPAGAVLGFLDGGGGSRDGEGGGLWGRVVPSPQGWSLGREGAKFSNSVPKVFIASQIDVLCANFVKFGRRKMDEIHSALLT